MGPADVFVAAFTLMNTLVATYAAWRLREIKRQMNGMREQLESAARAEGVQEGKETEIRRGDDAREALRLEAMRRGRRHLRLVDELEETPQ